MDLLLPTTRDVLDELLRRMNVYVTSGVCITREAAEDLIDHAVSTLREIDHNRRNDEAVSALLRTDHDHRTRDGFNHLDLDWSAA